MRLVVDDPATARLLSGAGDPLRTLLPPTGYSFSHAEPPLILVCRGEAPVDGWWDWRFAVDPATGELERIGPAY